MTNPAPLISLLTASYVPAISTVGLMSGLYWGFSVAVMPGLARVDDDTFVTTMRSINTAIQNPAFGLVFVGAAVFPTLALVGELAADRPGAAAWCAAGLVGYLVSVGVTLGINVPLNEALMRTPSTTSAARLAFERPWRAAHLARTLACTAGLALLAAAARSSRPVQLTSTGTLG